MATEVHLPQFGMGMQEGKLLRWFKHEGEPVQEGEPLCEVETEKAVVEVPAPQSGLLSRIIVEVDRTVPVLEVLAIIEPSGEALAAKSNEVNGRAAQNAPLARLQPSSTAATAATAARPHDVQVTPLARRVAKEHGIELSEVKGTGLGGRITDSDVRRAVASRSQRERPAAAVRPGSGDGEKPSATGAHQPPIQVEPRARRLADQQGIDLSSVTGTGPGGRITEDDVRQTAAGNRAPASMPSSTVSDSSEPQPRIIPLTGMRGAIARRMLQSIQTSAQLTLVSEGDVTALVKQREALSARFDTTYGDWLVRAAALALRQHPRLNAHVNGAEIHQLRDINIGVAVALADGLVVPVVRNADRKSIAAIAAEVSELVQRARSGKLSMAEITGSSFTMTNLGGFEIDAFTPILNPPEVAILGVGRIAERLTRQDSDLVWRQMMILSLTVDHRAVDGAPAAAFLQTVRQFLEQPELLVGET